MWAVIIWKIKIESKFQRSNFTTTHIEESRGVRREIHQDVQGCWCRKYLKYWKSELLPILSVYTFFVIPWCPIWRVLFFCSGAQGWSRGLGRGSWYSWTYHRLPSTLIVDLQLKCFTWRPQPSKSSKPTERLTLLVQVDRQIVAWNDVLPFCRCIWHQRELKRLLFTCFARRRWPHPPCCWWYLLARSPEQKVRKRILCLGQLDTGAVL